MDSSGIGSSSVARKRLLWFIDNHNHHAKRPIAFVACGGQGKTVAIHQLLAYWNAPFLYLPIKRIEGLEANFFKETYEALKNAIPGLMIDLFEEMASNGTLATMDPDQFAAITIRHIKTSPRNPFFIVFDDIHLLNEHSPVFHCVLSFVERMRSKTRMILSMRFCPNQRLQELIRVTRFQVIDDKLLVFSKDEVFEYINSLAKYQCSIQEVNQLHGITGGWITGILLKAQSFWFMPETCPFEAEITPMRVSDAAEDVYDYFSQEIFRHIPDPFLRQISLLAFMDEIQSDFIRTLPDHGTIIDTLDTCTARNLFINKTELRDRMPIYVIHHLLQDCLRLYAEKNVTKQEQRVFYVSAASFYKVNGQSDIAVKYFLKAGNYNEAQNVLKDIGIKLIDENRFIMLSGVLDAMPEDIRVLYPWLAYIYGNICMNSNPYKAPDYFYTAMNLFRKQQDEVGELLVMAQTIYYHIVIDGLFNKGMALLERAEELYNKHEKELTLISQIHCAICIASGHVFFTCEFAKAYTLTDKVKTLAEHNAIVSYQAKNALARGFCVGFQGNWPRFNEELNQVVHISNDPRLTLLPKSMIWLARINLLKLEGDFFNYAFLKHHVLGSIRGTMVEQSVFGPFLQIWDTDIAISQGDLHRAAVLIQEGLSKSFTYANPHLKSQLLHYRSYICAVNGDKEQAIGAAHEALKLRAVAGGKFFNYLCNMVLCGTFAHLGMHDECENHFRHGLDLSMDIRSPFVLVGLYVHRAFLYLKLGLYERVADDITTFLAILKQHKLPHFFSKTPCEMLPLMSFAVKNNIDKAFALEFTRRHLGHGFDRNGDPVPLLFFKILGGFYISVNNRIVLTANDFSPIQQKLLSHLLMRNDYSVDSGIMAETIWKNSKNELNALRVN